jgi:hypothetical protein
MVVMALAMALNVLPILAAPTPEATPSTLQSHAGLEMGMVTNIIRLFIIGATREAVQFARTGFKEMKTPAAKQELFTFLDCLGESLPGDKSKEREAFFRRYEIKAPEKSPIADGDRDPPR